MSKYRSQRVEVDGEVYDSKREARYAGVLQAMKRAGDKRERVAEVERQVVYGIEVNGHKICKYLLDFRVKYGDGRVEHVDVKGYRTPVYKLKKKLVEAIHGIKIIEA